MKLFIVDDFYSNFDEVRQAALNAEYENKKGERPKAEVWPGYHSKFRHERPDACAEIARLIGKRLYWHDSGTCQIFRYSPFKADRWYTKVHIDPTDWVGVVYLNTPEQARAHENCGTTFYRHRETNTEDCTENFETYYPLIIKDGWKADKWDTLISVPMKSNRLVVFQGRHWHSHSNNFGTTVEDSRLIHLYLFNEGEPPPEWQIGSHFYG
jgi:hypothetical protein